MGNLKRPRKGEFRNGSLLAKSVIVIGALHSETNRHQGHATADKRGVPVLAASLQALRNEPLTLFGDGKQTRSFQYVSDLIEGGWVAG